MIIDVEKYLFIGPKHQIDLFFAEAQKKGHIEFIGKEKRAIEVPKIINDLRSAIKVLRKQSVVKQLTDDQQPETSQDLVTRILAAEANIQAYEEELRVLRTEMTRVHAFGDFDVTDAAEIEKLSNRFIQYYCIKTSKRETLEIPDSLIYVGTEFDLDYFVGIHKEHIQFPNFIEMKIDKPLGALKERMQWVQTEMKKLEHHLKEYAASMNYLQETLVALVNAHNLKTAKGDIENQLEDKLFAIQGWIPKTKLPQVKELLSPMLIDAVPITVEETDRKPTCMENKGSSKLGEDLVKIYDIPAVNDKDPSLWVLFAFAIFFAMIVADAGYGLLYLALGLFLKWKFPQAKDMLKRMIQLVLMLATTCTVWGILTASFFGINLSLDNPLRRVSIIHYLAEAKASYHLHMQDNVAKEWAVSFPETIEAQSADTFFASTKKEVDGRVKYEALDEFYDNILMEVSLLAGIIHVILGFLRYIRRNLSAFGWITFIIGGYLFFPSMLKATSLVNFMGWVSKPVAEYVGYWMIWAGIGSAVLAAIIQKGLSGIKEIVSVIEIFADILSYLRLYALALASMIMAMTFNKIAMDMGIYVGVFVLLIGHGVNIVMGIMGGVIHGLRLNFLEWYHYCFDGGGKLFNPLRLLKLK